MNIYKEIQEIQTAIKEKDRLALRSKIVSLCDAMKDSYTNDKPEDTETTLKLTYQYISEVEDCYPELNLNCIYLLGQLKGYETALEELYRFDGAMRFAEETLSDNKSAFLILNNIAPLGTVSIGYLTEIFDTVWDTRATWSRVASEMRPLLLAKVVFSSRADNRTEYTITPLGEEYLRREKERKKERENAP